MLSHDVKYSVVYWNGGEKTSQFIEFLFSSGKSFVPNDFVIATNWNDTKIST